MSITADEMDIALQEIAADQAAWFENRQEKKAVTKNNEYGILFAKLAEIREYLKAHELMSYRAAASDTAKAIKRIRACFEHARLIR